MPSKKHQTKAIPDARRVDFSLDLMRLETIAHKLDISKRTLQTWVAKGEFPPADIRRGSRLVFWKRETYENWLAELK